MPRRNRRAGDAYGPHQMIKLETELHKQWSDWSRAAAQRATQNRYQDLRKKLTNTNKES